MTKILKKVQLSTEQSARKSVDPTKGTQTNPFTQVEMATLQEEGIWNGGYVERMGYVPSNANYGGMSDSGYYIYIYSTFVPIDTILHHTFENPDDFEKINVTDIDLKADIKGYIITIKVCVTIKDNNASGIDFIPDVSFGITDPECETESIDSDGKYHYQLKLELPKILPPTIKLAITCDYLYDNHLYDLTKEITILSPYDCYS